MKEQQWLRRPIVAVMLLSFSSALPLVLIGSTLQAWYTVSGVNLMTIGLLTLVGQPYVFKFLWAPLMDRYAPFLRDRRRGWILLTQMGLVLGLVSIALLNPASHPFWLAGVAFLVAFISASQDVAIDAYRVDILDEKTRGLGAAVTNLGGRGALLVGGALALIFAAEIGWRSTYLLMAGLLAIEVLVTCWSPSPVQFANRPKNIKAAVIEPIKSIFQREHVFAILLFVIVYKIGDAFAFALNTTFLIRGVGFTLEEVGVIYKVVSLGSLLLGSFVGGFFMERLGLYRSLLYFGILQAVANLAYMGLAMIGKSYTMMGLSVFAEYFCSGLGTVAFLVFLMSLCDRRYSASQYAIFSALMSIGRVFSGPEVAIMVDHLGWAAFYFATFLFGFPALVLLLWMKDRVRFEYVT